MLSFFWAPKKKKTKKVANNSNLQKHLQKVVVLFVAFFLRRVSVMFLFWSFHQKPALNIALVEVIPLNNSTTRILIENVKVSSYMLRSQVKFSFVRGTGIYQKELCSGMNKNRGEILKECKVEPTQRCLAESGLLRFFNN